MVLQQSLFPEEELGGIHVAFRLVQPETQDYDACGQGVVEGCLF